MTEPRKTRSLWCKLFHELEPIQSWVIAPGLKRPFLTVVGMGCLKCRYEDLNQGK